MGYDGAVENKAPDPFSLFYTDYEAIPQVFDFHVEVAEALKQIIEKYGELTLIDNSGIRSHYLKQVALQQGVKLQVRSPSAITSKNIHKVQEQLLEYQISDPLLVYWASLAEELHSPLLIPNLEIRIFNAQYSRRTQEVQDFNYFVYIFNERFYLFMKYLADNKKTMCSQFLLSTPGIFKSFFFTQEIQKWLQHSPGMSPHNYVAETTLFYNRHPGGQINENTWVLSPQKLFTENKRYQQSTIPLHRLYSKVFNTPNDLNREARALYGSIN